MLLRFKKLARCKQCNSLDTTTELMLSNLTLFSAKNIGEAKKEEKIQQPVEIICSDCGKIDRKKVKMEVS